MSLLAIGSLSRARYRIGAVLAIASIVVLGSSVATHASDPSYPVQSDGLSFDADDTLEANPCTTGYGNNLFQEEADPLLNEDHGLYGDFAKSDEVNFLRANVLPGPTNSLTYRRVAVIDGTPIDARISVTVIDGLVVPVWASNTDWAAFFIGSGSWTDWQNQPVLNRLDKCGTENARLVELEFQSARNRPNEGHFKVQIDFFVGTSGSTPPSVPARLTNLKMNVEDVDSNQYLEVDNFTSIRLAPERGPGNAQEYQNGGDIDLGSGITSGALSLSSPTARRFHALDRSDPDDPVSDRDKHVVEVTYASVESITLQLGTYRSSGSPSFELNFRGFTFQSDPVSPPAPATQADSPEKSVEPAIHLDMKGNIGAPVSASSALIEGQGLKRSSAYTLRLGPSGQVLKTGSVSRDGTFAHTISLPPGLSPGRYFVELSAVGANGEVLVLKQFFTVGSGGVLLSIETAMPTKASLANTGVGDTALLMAYGSMGLLFAGLTLVASARRPGSKRPVSG
jgi:hypothetical protein